MKKIVILIILLLGIKVLLQAESVLLKYKAVKGDVNYYLVEMKIKVEIKGKNGSDKIKLKNIMKTRKTIKEVGNEAFKVLVEVLESESYKNDVPIMVPGLSKKVLLVQKYNGEIISQKVLDGSNTTQKLDSLQTLVFPSTPVKMGSSWNGRVDLPRSGVTMSYKVTLLEIEPSSEGRLAKLKETIKFVPKKTGVDVSGGGSGIMYFNIDKGRVEKSDMVSKMKVSIPSNLGVLFETTTKMEMKLRRVDSFKTGEAEND